MTKGDDGNPIDSKILFLSTFPPKECGIATFTRDLVTAMNKRFNPVLKSRVVALNEDSDFYNYDRRVVVQMNKNDINDYEVTAEKLNRSQNIKLVCVQHEFGLFGGNYGSYLIKFLENIKKPVVVAFHSVLPNPDKDRENTVRAIASRSNAIIVMANSAVDILTKDYNINRSKIHVVHHGIPNVPLYPNDSYKKKLKLSSRIVLSTFGLLSKGKGIEYMIKALPYLVKKYPNIIYLVIGETHPVVRRNEGEAYRNELISLVSELGLSKHVKFYNKYLTLGEIMQHLLATDIYICTNLDRNQIVSGTLSYAMGCGRAIVSTSSAYAKEILTDEKGILVEFENPKSYAEAIDRFLSDDRYRYELGKRAYTFSRSMLWQSAAARYLNVFNKVVELRDEITKKYPPISLKHLIKLTDDFGCVQFSRDTIPDKSSGYTLDDNSRALIATALHHSMFKSKRLLRLIQTYLSFLENAQEENGNFQNNFYNTEETLNSHSKDAFGRAVWALGYVINKLNDPSIADRAQKMLEKALQRIDDLDSLRSKSFALSGLFYYYKKSGNDEILLRVKRLADSLANAYEENSSEGWHWFEKKLTYSNSKLPEALFFAYDLIKDERYLWVAETSLNFLSDVVFIDDNLVPIGQEGWYSKNGKRAFFDQQPIDASSMVQTCLSAYQITGDRDYYERAVLAFNWFLGRNYLKQMVYNESTGGCYDGLSKDTLNLNQGAESTISYLIARLRLEEIKKLSHHIN